MSSNTPKLDISTIFKSKEFPAQVYLPKLSMPKEGRPNFQAPNPETNRLLLLQDTVVKNNIQSTRYSSETNSSLSDYNQLINEIYPMETGVETNRTNSNEFHFFEMKKTTYNYFTINRIKSEDSKKDCASGLYNLFSIGAKGVEPIAKPQFGYAKMVLTTKM
jgi:hypothetical protein